MPATPLTPDGIVQALAAKGVTTLEQFSVFADYAVTQIQLNAANSAIVSAQARAADAANKATEDISAAQARRDQLTAHLNLIGAS